jgi:peptide/nickel transport system permease protein
MQTPGSPAPRRILDEPASTAALTPRLVGRSSLTRFLRRYPVGASGAALIVLMLALAVFAEWVAPYDPVVVDFGAMFGRPGRAHWFGSDAFGRDVLSRVIFGARTALIVGFGSSVLGATLGAAVGVASAYFGGLTDLLVQRLVDILISFPIIILAMAIVAIIGVGTGKLVLAMLCRSARRA